MVNRDSSFIFKKAIDEADPSIIQVSDRFHVVQNLRKTTESVLKRLIPAHFSLSHNNLQTSTTDTRLRVRKQRQIDEQKKELIKQVKRLEKQHISTTKIGKLLGLGPRTVKKYKQIEDPMHSGRGYRPPVIDPFVEELQRLVKEGYTNKGIDAHRRKLGFTGEYSTVRIRIEDFRRLLKRGSGCKICILQKEWLKNKEIISSRCYIYWNRR